MEIGFGIIGCGLIASFHAQAIAKSIGGTLVAVSDLSLERAEELASRYHAKAFNDYKQLLAQPEVDVVCICTPSGLHAQLVIEAAQHGKHVVVEKPLAITMEEGRAAVAACKGNNVKLAVISQLRFAPALQQAKAALEQQKLGKPLLGDAYMKYYRSQDYYDQGGWRGTWKMDGGGALMNQGIHGIDLLLWLMGPVTEVWGQAATLARQIEVEDTAVAAVRYASGAMGVIEGTTSVYPGYNRRLELHGDQGTIVLEEEQIIKWDLAGEEDKVLLGMKAFLWRQRSEPYLLEATEGRFNIGRRHREDREPLVTGIDGLQAIQLILAFTNHPGKEDQFRLRRKDLHV